MTPSERTFRRKVHIAETIDAALIERNARLDREAAQRISVEAEAVYARGLILRPE